MNFASVGVFGVQFLLTFMFIESSAITYGNYTYPVWSDALCSMMSLSVIVWIPVFAIYYLCTEPGDIMQVAKDLSRPILFQYVVMICLPLSVCCHDTGWPKKWGHFWSRSAMLERDIGIGGVSVRPSHAGIDSKLMNVGLCSFTAKSFHNKK